MYLFIEQCRKSNNICLRALMQSYFFIHLYSLNTTTAFYFVTECSDVTVFARGCVHATYFRDLTSLKPGLHSASYTAPVLFQVLRVNEQ